MVTVLPAPKNQKSGMFNFQDDLWTKLEDDDICLSIATLGFKTSSVSGIIIFLNFDRN